MDFDQRRFNSYHDRRQYACTMAELYLKKAGMMKFSDLQYQIGNLTGMGKRFLVEHLDLLKSRELIRTDAEMIFWIENEPKTKKEVV